MLTLKSRANIAAIPPCPEGISPILWQLLCARGITTSAQAQEFLHPDPSNISDPFLMPGMREAVLRIEEALERNERVVVYGDYDVDGVCASATLVSHLKNLGADCDVYLPSRHTEGYGLNENAVRALSEKFDLMITVDCGISSKELVALAEELGLSVIVTDHHQLPESIPECTVINPHIEGYPYPNLCGAGVAFQLVNALSGMEAALEYADFAGIATIADIVPLTGENRIIAACGIKKINTAPRPGIAALMEAAGIAGKAVSSETIAFQISPRLNAGGRLADARISYDLLTGEDEFELLALASRLNDENQRRQTMEKAILEQAEASLADFAFAEHRVIVVHGEGWNAGVIGLVASRLTEKYHMPSIALAVTGDTATGSCRSIPGVDIYQALCACGDYLVRFGGHRQAAGLTIQTENIAAFSAALDQYLFAEIEPAEYVPSVEYDLEIPLESADLSTISSLSSLQPTGFGNPAPVFLSRGQFRNLRRCGKDGSHLQFEFADEHATLSGIYFRAGNLADSLHGEYPVVYSLNINEYRGRASAQMQIKTLAQAEFAANSLSAQEYYQFQIAFLTDLLYNNMLSEPEKISLSKLDSLMSGVQGTLLIAAGEEAAQWAKERYPQADFFIGQYPGDLRAFHSICQCPSGDLSAKYANIVALDLPFHGCCSMLLDKHFSPGWLKELPDTDVLREIYKALRTALRTAGHSMAVDTLCETVASMEICTRVAAYAAIILFNEMGLVKVSPRMQVELVSGIKASPEDHPLYQRIQKLFQYAMEVG